MGFLRFDSEFMMAVSHAADYVLLNILCVLFCIPVVTIGAAVTAKYYVAMKLARGEEPAIWKSFLKSFRENLKQAMILWLIALVLIALFVMDWFLFLKMQPSNTGNGFRIAFLILAALVTMSIFCVFPLLARFHLTIAGAIRNAVLFSFLHVPQMFLVVLAAILPYYIGYHYIRWFLGIWFLCTGVSQYYASRMYAREFAKIEHKKNSAETEEQTKEEK